MAPVVTGPQLLAVVERARKRNDGRPVILVKGAPDTELADLTHNGTAVAVRATRSPLELRRIELESREGSETVVVITDLDDADLGDELRARIAGERIWSPERWEAVKMLFGVRAISRDLSRRRHLADALIEARPIEGYRAVRSSTLDLQTAVGALLRAQLGLSDAITSLERFIAWIDAEPTAANRVIAAGEALNTDGSKVLDEQLVERFGEGALAVLAIVRSGMAKAIMPLLFVGGAVHGRPELGEDADKQGAYALNLELGIGDRPIDSSAWLGASQAAVAAAWSSGVSDATRREWSSAAEALLSRFTVPELAERSDAIASGFELRLAQVGRDLADAAKAPDSAAVAAAVDASIAAARSHKYTDQVRVDRAEMAARLIRRGTSAIEWGGTLASAGAAYRSDGAWLDRARNAIARGDSVSTLAAVYRSISDAMTDSRANDNAAFAKIAAASARMLPDDVVGIEDVVRSVVAPAAEQQPVLLLVFDGMGYESFTEVSPLFEQVGFTHYVDQDGAAARPCYAVLPTVTEYSRTSLFAGEVRRGNQDSEVRAFREIPELVALSKSGDAPVIHHKAALRNGGIDSIPDNVLADIANEHQRVVAVVLNNIDERLKDVAGPVATWGFNELHPLRWLLEAARAAGRVVIATSDHGHVLDRDAEQRRVDGGRERWRSVAGEPEVDEVLVEGPRVVAENQRAILPFAEQVHYDSRRNGYHGGLCPQEVLVPVGVFAAADNLLEDWSPTALPEPDWWWTGPLSEAIVNEKPAPKPNKTKAKPAPDNAPTLFPSEDDKLVEVPEGADTWVDEVLTKLEQYRRPQIRLTHDEARRLLSALERNGSLAMPLDRLAATTQLPATRITRYVSQLQQLVNIDGYGILTVVGNEAHFDRHLFDTQIGLRST